MAKSSITVPSRVYQPGTRTVNLPNLSTDDNGLKIILTRESWPDSGIEVITGVIEGTNDGQNWFELTRFGYVGGDMFNPRTGQLVVSCGPTVYWPESYDQNGNAIPARPSAVRATVTNTVALTTGITLQGM